MHAFRVGLGFACALALSVSTASATLSVGVDVPTLNALLPALAPREVALPLGPERTMRVELHDIEVVGFDPAAGDGSAGHVLTRMRLVVPDLGLELALAPHLALRVVQEAGHGILELRLERAEIRLPVAGAINIGSMIPPMRWPAEAEFQMSGAAGAVPVRSRLTGVKMGVSVLRLDFELEPIRP